MEDALKSSEIIRDTPALAWNELKVIALERTTSTNDEALRRAREGAPHGTLIIAECQTAGRGRKGRRWLSPPGTGIYFSLILRPHRPPRDWVLLTHVASVALAQALNELFREGLISRPLDVDLKWPNDVLLSGKKTAGILLETAASGGALHSAVLGVGINVNPGAFPAELMETSTCISVAAGEKVSRKHILVRFLYHFQIAYDLFARGQGAEILEQWKKLSRMWNNTPVWIIENDVRRAAVTCGLTRNGALLVRTEAGTEETILAGDISIRPWERGEG
jgi:BirA family transcriptional regulator, biotin operon repressor / biotin---[acetyl-CoA-carboxylase] ligase